MRVVAVVQARTSSTRLPGKVLLPFGERSILASVILRVRQATSLAEVVVATSTDAGDDAIARECERFATRVVRGPLDDVLARYVVAARIVEADAVVRITADCPLIDPEIVDATVAVFASEHRDYATNGLVRTFPRGLDTEVFTLAALLRADSSANRPYEREHVTPYIYQHPELFSIGSYVDPTGADRSDWRWTLDTPEDYALLTELLARVGPSRGLSARLADLAAVVDRDPGLLSINAAVQQKKLGE